MPLGCPPSPAAAGVALACRRFRRRNQKDTSTMAISATPPTTPPAIAPAGAALLLVLLDGVEEETDVVDVNTDDDVDDGVDLLDVEEEVTALPVSSVGNT